MSFILDALRKSDARRKQGGVPDIHSPEPARPTPRRGRFLALWIALPVVLLAGVGVLLWAPWSGPPLDPDGPGVEVASNDTPGSSSGPGDGPATEESGEGASEGSIESSEPQAPEQSLADAEESQPRRRRRVPPEERAESSVAREPESRESEPVNAEEVADELGQRLAEAEREVAAAREREVRRQARRAESSQGAQDETPQRPSSAPARQAQARPEQIRSQDPGQDDAEEDRPRDYVEAWELPLSTRRSLPELALNMHVYSARAQDRFVLINGERRVEGDSLGQGAELVEIRREGALIAFRDRRFLLRRQ